MAAKPIIQGRGRCADVSVLQLKQAKEGLFGWSWMSQLDE
jgi:hypothetical protein